MEIELTEKGIPFESQKILDINYKGKILRKKYEPDLLIDNKVVTELKVMEKFQKNEESIILNYLNVTKFKVGLLINFGSKNELEWKRFVY